MRVLHPSGESGPLTMTRYVVLIGSPLKHSVSPYFQQAAFDYYRLDIRYETREVAEKDLKATVDDLRRPEMVGANVTIPYKERIVNLLDEVDGNAVLIGAVNTVVVRDGTLRGYNTDAIGFVRALRRGAGFDPSGKRAVILGAGGAARAVVFALLGEGINSVAVANRSEERAEELAAAARRVASRAEVMSLPWSSLSQDALFGCDLLVNCTSVGMKHTDLEGRSPLGAELIPPRALVCDLVYNPVETPLLEAARKTGAKTLEGLSMLVYQGAASFEMWTGKEAPLEVMFKGAAKALR